MDPTNNAAETLDRLHREGLALILYDGTCPLCNGVVRFLIRRDREAVFRFAPLQSELARHAWARSGGTGPLPDSVVLVDGPACLTESDAVLGILRKLGGRWRLCGFLNAIPKPLRDAVYRWVARNRQAGRGPHASCPLPPPELRGRFLA